MKMNCNLELRLDPGWQRNIVMEGESSGTSQQLQQQQLTIFYDGKVVVCDVTEFQARSILSMANREVEERMRTPTTGSVPTSPTTCLPPPMCSPPPGLSMKKSLQRFLQKRQHRLQATSPFQH